MPIALPPPPLVDQQNLLTTLVQQAQALVMVVQGL